MKLDPNIEPPKLSEIAQARIERALVEEAKKLGTRRKPQARLWLLPAVILASAAALLVVVLGRQYLDDTPKPLNTELSTLATHTEGTRLELRDATLILSEDSELRWNQHARSDQVVKLVRGRATFFVDKQAQGHSFVVIADGVKIEVIGTEFSVEQQESDVLVRVREGVVSVQTPAETLILREGEGWRGPKSGATKGRKVEAQVATIGRERANGLAPDESANARSKDTPARPVDEQDLDASFSREGRRPSEVAKASASKTRFQGASNGHGKRSSQRSKTVSLREVLRGAKPIKPVVQPSHGEKNAELLAIASANPKKAAHDFQTLAAQSRGHAASFAMYARAYLLYFELGDRQGVLQASERYKRRFPTGKESEDMLWLRVRASCDLGRYTQCRSAAHSYLARYPTGVFRGLATRIVQTSKENAP